MPAGLHSLDIASVNALMYKFQLGVRMFRIRTFFFFSFYVTYLLYLIQGLIQSY